MRGAALTAVFLLVVLAVWLARQDAPRESMSRPATVLRAADGDTLVVQLGDGMRERVRVLGIDTPELGQCHAAEATSAVRRLVTGRRVVLRVDRSQSARDRYGRTLAYVELPDGRDLGLELLRGGFARVLVVGRPFERLESYEEAEEDARGTGLWRCPAVSVP